MFDMREATYSELQSSEYKDGRIPLQTVSKDDWWLFIGVECIREGCDNILTPEGIQLMSKIDDIIENDPLWKKVCLLESPTSDKCANDIQVGG